MSQFDTPFGDFGEGITRQPTPTVNAHLDGSSSVLDPRVQPKTERIDLDLLKENIEKVRSEINNTTDSTRLQEIWISHLSQRVLLLASENFSPQQRHESSEHINTFFMRASKFCDVQTIKTCYGRVLNHITSKINSLRMENPITDDEKLYSLSSDFMGEARRSVFAFTQASWRRITIEHCLNQLNVKSDISFCEHLEALSESLYTEQEEMRELVDNAKLVESEKGQKQALEMWKSTWEMLEQKFAELSSENNNDTYFCDKSKQWKDQTFEQFKCKTEAIFKKMIMIEIDHSSLEEHVQKLKDTMNAENCTLRQLNWLFTRKSSASHANAICEVLYLQEKRTPRISKDFFKLIVEYIRTFKWTEIDKKQRIELFLDHLVDEVLDREQYLFQEKLNQLHKHIISLAESYFVRINIEQSTMKLWAIINKLHSKHFPNDKRFRYKKRFKKLCNILKPLELPAPGLADLCSHNCFSRRPKDIMNSFVDQLVRIIQSSFDPATSDGDYASDTIVPHKFRDITKYGLKMMLIENVLPVAKNCLYVVGIQNSLQNFLEIPEKSFRAKLENFNKEITEKVYDDRDDAQAEFFEKLKSNLDKHCQLQKKVCDVWKSFDQTILDLLNSESRAPNASGLLKQELRNEIQLVFQKTVDDLAAVEITQVFIKKVEDFLISINVTNEQQTSCLFQELKVHDINQWEEEAKFVKSLHNIRTFDKHKDLKVELRNKFLQAVVLKVKVKLDIELFRGDTGDNTAVHTHLEKDIRDVFKVLREEWGKQFALKEIEVQQLLKTCDTLSEEIERSYPDKQLLLDLFSEKERATEKNFTSIMKTLIDGNETIDKNKQFLLNSIEKICNLEDKREARTLLSNFWLIVKSEVQKFFNKQLKEGSTESKQYEKFIIMKMSQSDVESLFQETIFNLVEVELLDQAGWSELNFAKYNPLTYVCQRPSIRQSQFVRAKLFKKLARPVTAILFIIVSIVYLGWSNVSNFINSSKENPIVHLVLLVIFILPFLIFVCANFKRRYRRRKRQNEINVRQSEMSETSC